jgi:hypothetical protein
MRERVQSKQASSVIKRRPKPTMQYRAPVFAWCYAEATTKHRCKVRLTREAAGRGHLREAASAADEHLLRTANSPAQNVSVRAHTNRLPEPAGEMIDAH